MNSRKERYQFTFNFGHVALKVFSLCYNSPVGDSPFPSVLSEQILVVARHCYQHWGSGQGKYSNKYVPDLW